MGDDDVENSPVEELVLGLTEFLDEASHETPEGYVRVERLRVTLPVELYAREAASAPGRVAAIEARPPLAMLTSFMPVLHQLSLVVEVQGAEQRQPSLES
jgi:hypothetical protein